MMDAAEKTYLPAAGHDIFLPFYDPLVKLIGGDAARRTLLDQAGITAGDRVLDIGCGTGTMVLLIKRTHPQVEVIGLDPDRKALARARGKAERAQLPIQLDQGYSDALPYADASFDRVLSSFMFHHLEADQKLRTLGEVVRVLKPGGSFHMLDFSKPPSNGGGVFARLAHSSHHLAENTEDRILGLMRQAGFRNPETVHRGKMMLFLRTGYFRAVVSR